MHSHTVFSLPASVKDMIEALGVPHTEVDIILVNDGPVDFGYLVQDGDSIRVYPASTSQYIPSAVSLRPQSGGYLRSKIGALLAAIFPRRPLRSHAHRGLPSSSGAGSHRLHHPPLALRQ